MDLVTPEPGESSWTRDATNVPCIVRRILKLWTVREVPMSHSAGPLCVLGLLPSLRSPLRISPGFTHVLEVLPGPLRPQLPQLPGVR